LWPIVDLAARVILLWNFRSASLSVKQHRPRSMHANSSPRGCFLATSPHRRSFLIALRLVCVTSRCVMYLIHKWNELCCSTACSSNARHYDPRFGCVRVQNTSRDVDSPTRTPPTRTLLFVSGRAVTIIFNTLSESRWVLITAWAWSAYKQQGTKVDPAVAQVTEVSQALFRTLPPGTSRR